VVGKHEFITYAAAISPQGKVLGIEVLIYRETYGYQVRDASWRNQFKGKTLQDAFKLDADVTNVTGATLSCRNVMNGVKRLLALQRVALQP
jgi:Na+-translocating ferredoxin:NAD+ oxidoreductase RnfG subunit